MNIRTDQHYYTAWRVWSSKIAYTVRKKFFDLFIKLIQPNRHSAVLDAGVTSDLVNDGDNYFEKFYPWPDKITAIGIEDASYLEKKYPGLKFIQADATQLPFPDQFFDIVFSAAVAEHVGSFEKQKKFYHELLRVGRKVFITTPNRWFPFEAHTGWPLLHFLPKKLYRAILRALGLHYFADEANLNLLTTREIKSILANQLNVKIIKKYNSIIVIKN